MQTACSEVLMPQWPKEKRGNGGECSKGHLAGGPWPLDSGGVMDALRVQDGKEAIVEGEGVVVAMGRNCL